MGYALGTGRDGQDIGYGVDDVCNEPGCEVEIDRGMAYACGGDHFNEECCGGFFCYEHLLMGHGPQMCRRCAERHPDEDE
jgi:hypothetical protein